MTRPIVILDVEATGTEPGCQPWEFAALERRGDQTRVHHFFIEHDASTMDGLPEKFRTDHDLRFRPDRALTREAAAERIERITRDTTVVGASPWFDCLQMIEPMMREHGIKPSWHYRLRCVTSMATGFFGRDPGGLAATARLLGVPVVDSHQALGDVMTTAAVYDRLTGSRVRLWVSVLSSRARRVVER